MVKIKLNPDADIVKKIKARLVLTDGYCPCLYERTPDTICPCKVFRETKECHCGLFVKVEE